MLIQMNLPYAFRPKTLSSRIINCIENLTFLRKTEVNLHKNKQILFLS